MRKMLTSILTFTGIISLMISLMSGYYAVIAYVDRSRYGPGLFFADVEIFTAITLFFILAGSVALWVSYRIRKHSPPENNNK